MTVDKDWNILHFKVFKQSIAEKNKRRQNNGCCETMKKCHTGSVWPDWAIYCTLGSFSKPVATIILPKLPTFLGKLSEAVKIFHFNIEYHFWATFIDIWRLFTGHTALDAEWGLWISEAKAWEGEEERKKEWERKKEREWKEKREWERGESTKRSFSLHPSVLRMSNLGSTNRVKE